MNPYLMILFVNIPFLYNLYIYKKLPRDPKLLLYRYSD